VHITSTSQCEWPEKWARKQLYKWPVYFKIFIKQSMLERAPSVLQKSPTASSEQKSSLRVQVSIYN
jgi:hypothetical protein